MLSIKAELTDVPRGRSVHAKGGPEMEQDNDTVADRVYEQLKAMAISFAFKPGEHLNEGRIALRFAVSRTPLREALNRLKNDGFLRFVPGRGFYRRDLDADEIFRLYELRRALEVSSVRLAAERASDEEIAAIRAFLKQAVDESREMTRGELVEADETFHLMVLDLGHNEEFRRVLENVYARIRFVRWVDMAATDAEHRAIVDAIAWRDADGAAAALERHIARRLEEITASVRRSVEQIGVGGMGA